MRLKGKRGRADDALRSYLPASPQQRSTERKERPGHIPARCYRGCWNGSSPEFLVAEVARENRRFRKLVLDQPSWYTRARSSPPHVAREHVTTNALQQALRQHGVASCHEVALAVLEVDGSITCMKYDDIKPTALTHLARRNILKKRE
jgi:hypothetical protein